MPAAQPLPSGAVTSHQFEAAGRHRALQHGHLHAVGHTVDDGGVDAGAGANVEAAVRARHDRARTRGETRRHGRGRGRRRGDRGGRGGQRRNGRSRGRRGRRGGGGRGIAAAPELLDAPDDAEGDGGGQQQARGHVPVAQQPAARARGAPQDADIGGPPRGRADAFHPQRRAHRSRTRGRRRGPGRRRGRGGRPPAEGERQGLALVRARRGAAVALDPAGGVVEGATARALQHGLVREERDAAGRAATVGGLAHAAPPPKYRAGAGARQGAPA